MSRSGSEPTYAVVSPVGVSGIESISASLPVLDLRGKTICELWDQVFKGDQIFAIVRKMLAERFPNVRSISHETFGDTTPGDDPVAHEKQLSDRLRALGCDAVISAVGN